MHCRVGCRCSSDSMWLWSRPAAAAPICPLAWELPYATGVALKKKKKKFVLKIFLRMWQSIQQAFRLKVKSKIFEGLRRDIYQNYRSAEGCPEYIFLTQEIRLSFQVFQLASDLTNSRRYFFPISLLHWLFRIRSKKKSVVALLCPKPVFLMWRNNCIFCFMLVGNTGLSQNVKFQCYRYLNYQDKVIQCISNKFFRFMHWGSILKWTKKREREINEEKRPTGKVVWGLFSFPKRRGVERYHPPCQHLGGKGTWKTQETRAFLDLWDPERVTSSLLSCIVPVFLSHAFLRVTYKCYHMMFVCLWRTSLSNMHPMFTVALFTTAKTWEPKYPSTDEAINMWYIYTSYCCGYGFDPWPRKFCMPWVWPKKGKWFLMLRVQALMCAGLC